MLPQYQPLPDSYYPSSYQQRLAQLEAQQSYNPQYDRFQSGTRSPSYLKGRPVVSLEEARAAQIDLDGSLFIFTDIGNQKIYTKQINLDGIAVLKTYALVEDNLASSGDYVTRAEMEKIIASIRNEFSKVNEERNAEQNESINEQRYGTTKKAVREQPTF